MLVGFLGRVRVRGPALADHLGKRRATSRRAKSQLPKDGMPAAQLCQTCQGQLSARRLRSVAARIEGETQKVEHQEAPEPQDAAVLIPDAAYHRNANRHGPALHRRAVVVARRTPHRLPDSHGYSPAPRNRRKRDPLVGLRATL